MKTIRQFLTTQTNIEPVDSVYAPNPWSGGSCLSLRAYRLHSHGGVGDEMKSPLAYAYINGRPACVDIVNVLFYTRMTMREPANKNGPLDLAWDTRWSV